MAVYGFTLAGAGKLAPTLAGLINYYQSWQWTLVSIETLRIEQR